MVLQGRGQAFGTVADIVNGPGQQPQHRQALAQSVRIQVEAQDGIERRNDHLVVAQGPLHRVLLDFGDQIGAPGDDARLRSAQQFVAAEGDQVGALFQGILWCRFIGQAIGAEVDQCAAAQIDNKGQAVFPGQGRHVLFRHRLGEALDGVIRRMHLHQQRRPGADRPGEVLEVGAVGGADLDQLAAGPFHNVGNAEGAADLDQLAARHRHLFALGQGVEDQQHGGGVVVDGGGGLGPGQAADEVFQVVVPVAAFSPVQIIFHVGRRLGRAFDGGQGGGGHRGPAQVGMDDGTGQVEDGGQAGPRFGLKPVGGQRNNFFIGQVTGITCQNVPAQGLQCGAKGVDDGPAAMAVDQESGLRPAQKFIDGGQGAQGVVRLCIRHGVVSSSVLRR